MVILISAASCTGKTLMAQKLLEKYHMPYLSVDLIKMGLFRSDINCGFTPTDSDEHIESLLWPILKGIIETTIENGQNLIIEGAYIFPQRLNEVYNEYNKMIIPVFMGLSKNYIENNYDTGIIKHKSVIEQKDYSEDWNPGWFIDGNLKMKKRCLDNNVQYFEIEKDYNNEIMKVYKYIDTEIERLQFI